MENNLHELVDAYLHGELAEAEQEAFESRVSEDPELAEALQLQKDAAMAFDILDREGKKAFLQQLEPASRKRNLFSNKLWVSSAATLLILFAFSFVFANLKYNPDSLIADAFEVPDASLFKSENQPISTFQDAIVAYQSDNFLQAQDLFSTALSYEKNINLDSLMKYEKAYFFLGISFLKNGQGQDSREIFSLIRQNGTLTQSAGWYEALSLLQLGQKEQAQILMTSIVNDPEHEYHQEAQKLTRRLKSKWNKLVF